jgi:enterochelin esterase-like enzyme
VLWWRDATPIHLLMQPGRNLAYALLMAVAILAVVACGPADGRPSQVVLVAGATASASASAEASAADTANAGTAAPTATLTPGAAPIQDPTSSPAAPSTATPTPWPSSTPSPTPCAETEGLFTSVDVPSTILNYDIHTRIYLPPCYATSGKSYPVLYLIHGLNYAEDQWERLGVGTSADRLIASGQIAPLIIVLPRDRDDPGLDPAFVVDLVPYVDSHYRTLASAGYRAIGGMSRGGGWSIHLGLRYVNVFGRIGAHSPAIFFGDENNVLKYLRAVAKTGAAPALYIDVGADDEQRQSAVWLDKMLTAFRVSHTYVTPPGDHSENYWAAHLDDYLRFYAAIWRPAPPPSPTPVPSATRRFE